MFPLLKKVCRRQHQKGSSSQKPRSTRLFLEALEDRTVPTVVFNSAFGGDTIVWGPNWWGEPVGQTVTGPLNNNPGALQDPKVYLIFWGPSWTQANAGKFASDAQAIINSAYAACRHRVRWAARKATRSRSQASIGSRFRPRR